MRERPILFSGSMVRAILDGTKTRTKLYAPAGTTPLDRNHLARRLLNGIGHIDEHGCWIWCRTTSAGYGSMTVGGRTVRVHRLMLALSTGAPVEELDEACHNCPGGDNPLCLNPEHLFAGTHGDNVRDAIRKGRAAPPVGPRLLGSSNPASKLTEYDVAAVRAAIARGDRQAAIATRFSVSQSLISAIARGRVRHA